MTEERSFLRENSHCTHSYLSGIKFLGKRKGLLVAAESEIEVINFRDILPSFMLPKPFINIIMH